MDKFAPRRLAPNKDDPLKLAFDNTACLKLTPLRLAPLKSCPTNEKLLNVASVKFAFGPTMCPFRKIYPEGRIGGVLFVYPQEPD